MKTMRALVKVTENKSYELKETEVPEPLDDEVLVKMEGVGLCGSDIALYEWNDVGKAIANTPFIPGHECTGTVVKVNSVTAVKQHKVVVRSMPPSPLGIDEATLLEAMGVAHNAVEQADVRDETVLIIGAGPIGLLATSIAKVQGAKRVSVADFNDHRLDLALQMHADVIINTNNTCLKTIAMKETNNNGVSRIIEASGNNEAISSMFELLQKGGQIVMVGIPKHTITIPEPLTNLTFKSLTLKTIHGRRIFHTWRECEKLIATKQVDVTPIVSHKFPLSNFEDAFKSLISAAGCKVIIDPQQ